MAHGINCKLRTVLHKQYAEILESYFTERFFRIKQGDAYSELKDIKAGVPQGSVLGPVLYCTLVTSQNWRTALQLLLLMTL